MAESGTSKLKYRAVSSFTAAGEGELSITQGSLLFAPHGDATNGWIFVQTLHEPVQSGYVPVSYLQLEPSKADLARRQSQKKTVNPFDSAPLVNHKMGSSKPKNENQTSVVRNGALANGSTSVPDQYRTSHAAKFKKTLEYWRERERRFMAGEEERLPVAKRRVYFYWDKNGIRHGPLTEQQMRAKFENREVATTTTVALATEDDTEHLQKKSVQEFFPEVHKAFQTVPLVKDDGLWWCYLDDLRNIQGPYAAEQMYEWFQQGYFNAETLVQLSTKLDQPFVPLSSLFPDGSGAFLTEGVAPSSFQPAATAAPTPTPAIGAKPTLDLDFDPTFKALKPIEHEEAFFTKPLNSIQTSSSALSTRFTEAQLGDVLDDPGGWRVEADPWSIPPQQSQDPKQPPPLDSKFDVDEFDPLAAGTSGRNLLARALSSQQEPGIGQSGEKDLNINDIKIELSNPLGNAEATTDVDVDPYNLDWFSENAGKDMELHVDMPEPEPAEVAKMKRAESSKKEKEVQEKKPAKRKLASLQTIRTKHLHTLEALYVFLTRPLPKDLGIVQCRIKRITTGLHVRANLYQLYLESGGKRLGPQILRATKHRQSVRSHYLIRIGDVNKRENGKPICELIHNHRGTQFVLHNDVVDHIGKPRDLCALSYTSNFEKQGGPRKMKVALPAFKSGSSSDVVNWRHYGNKPKESKLMSKFNDLQFKDMIVLKNKTPKWNPKRRAWTLDFHGRVKTSSVKNFQLVDPKENERVILQHGKVGFDDFTMDMQWPMSPVTAFAICLSSLHGKLAVE